jgi:hypothetical protein
VTVQASGALVGREDRKRDMAAPMFAGPALGEPDQGAADAFAVVFGRDDQVRDVAIQCAGEEIFLRLQMQEPQPFAIFVLGDEQMRGRR